MNVWRVHVVADVFVIAEGRAAAEREALIVVDGGGLLEADAEVVTAPVRERSSHDLVEGFVEAQAFQRAAVDALSEFLRTLGDRLRQPALPGLE
jgi:hypothetical protein